MSISRSRRCLLGLAIGHALRLPCGPSALRSRSRPVCRPIGSPRRTRLSR